MEYELIFGVIFGLIYFLLLIGLYLLPTIIANYNNHINITAIVLVNLLSGWTFIGWLVALIWAVSKSNPHIIHNNNTNTSTILLDLKNLKDDGVLTAEEFEIEKNKIINKNI